jgi:hypothetical protein
MPFPLAESPAQIDIPAKSKPHAAPLELPALVRLVHLASLDAPSIAVVWSLCFSSAAGIHLPGWVPLLLALGTWSVYVADRLLDARRAFTSDRTRHLRERHFFHWHHRRLLIPMAASVALAAATIIFSEMPAALREHNSVLALAALVYFSGVHLPRARRRIPSPLRSIRLRLAPFPSKEFLVGVLFTAGCAAPTLTRLHGAFTASLVALLFLVAYFACLAWLNCAAIDCWESKRTSQVGVHAVLLGCIGLLAALVYAGTQPQIGLVVAAGAASAFLLGLLDRTRCRMTPLTLRCAADLVLLTPVVCLLPSLTR